jgi:hypothetical protein
MSDSGQTIRSGPHSANVQIVHVNPGLTEVRQIVLDIVHAEFHRYVAQGLQEAERRRTQYADRLVERVAQEPPSLTQTFADPDIQSQTLAVGSAYVNSGDNELLDLLIDLLIERCGSPGRTIRAVVLNDAISTAARLTSEEFAALSVGWLITLGSDWVTIDDAIHQLRRHLAPHLALLPTGSTEYRHLEYTGCVSLGLSFWAGTFYDDMRAIYPHLFHRDLVEIDAQGFDTALLERVVGPSLREADARVFIASRSSLPYDYNIDFEVRSRLEALIAKHEMSSAEITTLLNKIDPSFAIFEQRWFQNGLADMRLTSVGVAIAHANCRRATGLDIPLDTAL